MNKGSQTLHNSQKLGLQLRKTIDLKDIRFIQCCAFLKHVAKFEPKHAKPLSNTAQTNQRQ